MRPARKLVCAAVVAAIGASASPSAATAGEFDQFKQCPLSNHEINDCFYTVTNGGSVKLGATTISLVNPVTLQGGYIGYGSETQFYGAENGDTLSKTSQPVPTGLAGQTAPNTWPGPVQSWFNETIGMGYTGVSATIELTGPTKGHTDIGLNTENLLLEEGVALSLPVRVKLNNTILGSNCYIGSETEPVQLELTTGKSGSLTGTPGEITFNEEFTIITISKLKLVDGTFAAPAASGCGGTYSAYVDPLIDSIFELPASSGKNSATLEGTLRDAGAEATTTAFMM
jgi:hypothetical protein